MAYETNTYEYEILPESPASKDELSDGIHENVANQLLGVFDSSLRGLR